MKLYLVAFGRMKTPGLAESADYYRKLLRSLVTTGGGGIEEVELKPLTVPDKSSATRAHIQEKEAALLEEKLGALLGGRGAYYLLDEAGKPRSTLQWAELVRDWESASLPEIALCVGSSLGFSDRVRKKARGLLSLGPQTLPHELARVVLLEQVYRAFSVTRGHPYHVQG
jgi:23S rRNA (pseudouridine1915-N3)-methyltransferase